MADPEHKSAGHPEDIASEPEAEPEKQVDSDEAVSVTDATAPQKRRNLRFRRDLLKRLPQLSYDSWSIGGQFSVDDDLRGVVDLEADTILKPIETLVDRLDKT